MDLEAKICVLFVRSQDKKDQMRRDSRNLQMAALSAADGTSAPFPTDIANIDDNLLSGFWSMMDDEPMDSGFPVTVHGYDIYTDNRVDWLQRMHTTSVNTTHNQPLSKQFDLWLRTAGHTKSTKKH